MLEFKFYRESLKKENCVIESKTNHLNSVFCIFNEIEKILKPFCNKTIIIEENLLSINTYEYLLNCYYYYCRKKSYSKEMIFGLNKLFSKYEIFGKIFTEYNHNFNKIGENFSDLRVYVLLLLNCNILYRETNDIYHLNTLLKLRDFVLYFHKQIDYKYLDITFLCVEIVRLYLEEYYDRFGCRMFTYRQ